jgi:hypothetical protein
MERTAETPRGQYGSPATDGKGRSTVGVVAILVVAVGIYAFSPGARHWYKHGRLPPYRRR